MGFSWTVLSTRLAVSLLLFWVFWVTESLPSFRPSILPAVLPNIYQMTLPGPQPGCKAPDQALRASLSNRLVKCRFHTFSLPLLRLLSASPRCSLLTGLPNALLLIVDAPKPPTEDTYLRFDEYGSAGRPRRSAGKSQKGLNVETLVVADKKMVEKHGKANVTTYILTVMNMVRGLSGLRPSKQSGIRNLHGSKSRCNHVILWKEIKFWGNQLYVHIYLVNL